MTIVIMMQSQLMMLTLPTFSLSPKPLYHLPILYGILITQLLANETQITIISTAAREADARRSD